MAFARCFTPSFFFFGFPSWIPTFNIPCNILLIISSTQCWKLPLIFLASKRGLFLRRLEFGNLTDFCGHQLHPGLIPCPNSCSARSWMRHRGPLIRTTSRSSVSSIAPWLLRSCKRKVPESPPSFLQIFTNLRARSPLLSIFSFPLFQSIFSPLTNIHTSRSQPSIRSPHEPQ